MSTVTDQRLEAAFLNIDAALQNLPLPTHPETLYAPIRYTLADSGKRIRPKLAVLGAALAGSVPENGLHGGIAMELLHNFTLIHDDIMDRADTRRGKPTVYRKWGVSEAILSGDMLCGVAYARLSEYAAEPFIMPEQLRSIFALFHEAVREVCEGQARDMEFENTDTVTEGAYTEMIRQKTAALLSAALQIGGVAAGANPRQLTHLRELGTQAGIAFQIQDDLLDVIADPSRFGKKRGGDIMEGKKTWLMIRALKMATGADALLLSEILQTKNASESQIDAVINLYNSLGLMEDARKEIEQRYAAAMVHLGEFTDTPYHNHARKLFDALLQRDF